MVVNLRSMTDEELTSYREDLNSQKVAIKKLECAAEEEFQVREALKGVPGNVKKIILEGRVEASGDASVN